MEPFLMPRELLADAALEAFAHGEIEGAAWDSTVEVAARDFEIAQMLREEAERIDPPANVTWIIDGKPVAPEPTTRSIAGGHLRRLADIIEKGGEE